MAGADDALARFSRDAFESDADPAKLCEELEELLAARLASSSDHLAEAHAIVRELRAVGHLLCCWDEADDFSIWGDDYVTPPRATRFLLEMRWHPEEAPCQAVELSVEFGPWPT